MANEKQDKQNVLANKPPDLIADEDLESAGSLGGQPPALVSETSQDMTGTAKASRSTFYAIVMGLGSSTVLLSAGGLAGLPGYVCWLSTAPLFAAMFFVLWTIYLLRLLSELPIRKLSAIVHASLPIFFGMTFTSVGLVLVLMSWAVTAVIIPVAAFLAPVFHYDVQTQRMIAIAASSNLVISGLLLFIAASITCNMRFYGWLYDKANSVRSFGGTRSQAVFTGFVVGCLIGLSGLFMALNFPGLTETSSATAEMNVTTLLKFFCASALFWSPAALVSMRYLHILGKALPSSSRESNTQLPVIF